MNYTTRSVRGRLSTGHPLSIYCRVIPIDSTYEYESGKLNYDKEKYKEMILDAAETVLGYFGFDRTVYRNKKNIATRKWKWLEELRQEREKDINVEIMGKQNNIQ